jgi:hypothetical protein
MVNNAKFSVDEASLRYQALTKLADLSEEIASLRNPKKSVDQTLQATKIRLWLKALDLKNYLTREQRERIWYALIQLSDVYDFPIAPVLSSVPRPSILIGNDYATLVAGLADKVDRVGDTMTGDLNFTGAGVNDTDYVQFNTAYNNGIIEGRVQWNSDDGTLEVGLPGSNINADLISSHEKVVNKTGSTLLRGKVVYINGNQGNRPTVTYSTNATEGGSSKTFGILEQNINNNGSGYVITHGLLRNIDTAAYTAGQSLYLGTNGDITNVKPSAPAHMVSIGKAIDIGATGSIYVTIINGFELNELHDVSISSPTNDQVIKYNSTTGLWVNGTAPGGGGGGTVTSVSVVSANGFAGTVANSTTTPAITLSTTVTGILKGNGTSISAATAGVDYLLPTSQHTDYDSTVTGLRNSVNKVFTTSFNFVSTSTKVYVNGLRYTPGLSYDYQETGANQITFTNAPDSGDLLIIEYIKS